MKSQLIEIALKEYGVHESPSPNDSNPRVLYFFAESGNAWVKDDTNNAWCSAFMGYLAKTCGLPITGSLLARSWLTIGQPTTTPEIGDVVVFWRDDINSTHGHVSLFIKKDGDNIYCLGGNQSDQVNISIYPASRVLGYRDITLPATPQSSQPSTTQSITTITHRLLKKGDTGDDVKLLQTKLGITADGDFGPITESHVKLFQTLHNLVSDGIVGNLTWGALLKLN